MGTPFKFELLNYLARANPLCNFNASRQVSLFLFSASQNKTGYSFNSTIHMQDALFDHTKICKREITTKLIRQNTTTQPKCLHSATPKNKSQSLLGQNNMLNPR
jgi:hypothetical protein